MRSLVIIFLSVILTINTGAQNKKSPWSFSSNNSFAYFAGNINKFDATTFNEIAHTDSISEFSFDYNFLYGEQADNRYLLEHMVSAFYDYHPHRRLSPWVNATFLHNIYKGFTMRFNTAAGVKYRFIHTEDQDWSLSTGILWDHLNYSAPTEAGTAARNTENIWRLSIRPKVKIRFSETAKLKHVTFYQPQINNFNNFIAWSLTELSFKVIKNISVTTSYYYFYNSRPAYSTISKTDQRVLFGFKVEL